MAIALQSTNAISSVRSLQRQARADPPGQLERIAHASPVEEVGGMQRGDAAAYLGIHALIGEDLCRCGGREVRRCGVVAHETQGAQTVAPFRGVPPRVGPIQEPV